MTVYFITILLVTVSSLAAQRFGKIESSNGEFRIIPSRLFVFIVATCLVIVGGLRWRVGTDYWQYSINYDRYVTSVWNSLITFSEPGINIIAWISSKVYDDYTTMFFIASLITITLFVTTISKYSRMFAFAILLYIFIGAWQGSFNGVRQYLACAVLFAGHRYILNKKFLKYSLVVLIASIFHISSLSMIILYFIPRKKLGIRNLLFLITLSLIVIYSYGFIFEFIEAYKESSIISTSYAQREVSLLRVLVAFAPLLLYFTLTNKSKLSKEDSFYINLLFVNAAVMLATSQSAYLARFALYTNVFTIFGIPRLININDKYSRLLLQFIIIVLYAVFWYIEVSKTSNLVNFRWIFERNI